MRLVISFVLSILSTAAFGEPVFSIVTKGLDSEIIQNNDINLDIEVTNNSNYQTDIVVTAGFQNEGVSVDENSCTNTMAKGKCHLKLKVTPKGSGNKRFVVEASGFDGKYISDFGKDVGVKNDYTGSYNIYVSHASTYPRSVMTGLIAANSSKLNDVFDLYYWKAKENKISENVFIKGAVPLAAESVRSEEMLDLGSGCDDGGCEPDIDKPLQELEEISKLVMNVPDGKIVNLIIEESFVRYSKKLMTPEALARTNSIKIIIEGSGSIVPNNRLDNTLLFAEQARKHGVEEFFVQIFASMDLQVLAKAHKQWESVINSDYIKLLPISFSELSKEIVGAYELDVLGKLIDNYGYDLKTGDVSKLLIVVSGDKLPDNFIMNVY